MLFGALGDIHGDFASARRIMGRHPEVPFWLCVGDVADAAGRYEGLPAPLYWIKGNNENFDVIATMIAHDADSSAAPPLPANLYYIPNGQPVELPSERSTHAGRLRVAGLGGTFAPTMYELPAAELPHPKKASAKATELADRRRHFVREEVERSKALESVDVFLSHEAPVPFRVERIQAGKRPINEVLAAMRPRLHLFGHHHRFQASTAEGVRSVCLDLVRDSYLLIDRKTLEYQHLSS
jgi:predicted phosphodiesterase